MSKHQSEQIILVNKPEGFTPLQAIQLFKEQHQHYKDKKISYAGRLDPMAEGLLILLVDDENKRRKIYEHLPKTYVFSILVGLHSDTYDVMGRLSKNIQTEFNIGTILQTLTTLQGPLTISIPPFSSKRVNGKPLFWYARNNLMSTIPQQSQNIVVHSLEILESVNLQTEKVYESISLRINRTQGVFRQGEILNDWNDVMTTNTPLTIPIITAKASVSSGAFIRGLVHHLSIILRVPMLTYTIKRTAIGSFSLDDAYTLVL